MNKVVGRKGHRPALPVDLVSAARADAGDLRVGPEPAAQFLREHGVSESEEEEEEEDDDKKRFFK